MGFFEQWYRASDNNLTPLSPEQAAKFLFLFHYHTFDKYLQENWKEYVKDYIIRTPLNKFGPMEHLTLFIEWCHKRDITI